MHKVLNASVPTRIGSAFFPMVQSVPQFNAFIQRDHRPDFPVAQRLCAYADTTMRPTALKSTGCRAFPQIAGSGMVLPNGCNEKNIRHRNLLDLTPST